MHHHLIKRVNGDGPGPLVRQDSKSLAKEIASPKNKTYWCVNKNWGGLDARAEEDLKGQVVTPFRDVLARLSVPLVEVQPADDVSAPSDQRRSTGTAECSNADESCAFSSAHFPDQNSVQQQVVVYYDLQVLIHKCIWVVMIMIPLIFGFRQTII